MKDLDILIIGKEQLLILLYDNIKYGILLNTLGSSVGKIILNKNSLKIKFTVSNIIIR